MTHLIHRTIVGVVLSLLTNAATASASPITIVQIFGAVTDSVVVIGPPATTIVGPVSGEWVFTVWTDTENPDLRPDLDTIGFFATSFVTLTQTGLGLVNVPVTSHLFYYEIDSTSSPVLSQSGLTRTLDETANFSGTRLTTTLGTLGDPNVIEQDMLTFGSSVAGDSMRFLSTRPLVLADGRVILFPLDGTASPALGSTQTVSPALPFPPAPIPEPASLLLVGTGLIGAGVRRYRQSRARQ